MAFDRSHQPVILLGFTKAIPLALPDGFVAQTKAIMGMFLDGEWDRWHEKKIQETYLVLKYIDKAGDLIAIGPPPVQVKFKSAIVDTKQDSGFMYCMNGAGWQPVTELRDCPCNKR